MTIPPANKAHVLGLLGQQRLEEAKLLAEQALAAAPTDASWWGGVLGVIHGMLDNPREAERCAREAIRLKPDSAQAHNNLGLALRLQGRGEEAIAPLREAIRLKPDYADAHYNLGASLAAVRRFEEAIESYRQALRLRPDDAEILNDIGNALSEVGRHREAIECYQGALAVRPDYPEASNNLGVALATNERFEEAIKCYRQALTIRPDYPEALNNLGVALAAQAQFEEAIDYYQKALALRPEYPEAHINTGYALRNLWKLDEALLSFKSAHHRDQTVSACHGMGVVETDKKHFTQAAAHFKEALTHDPRHIASELGIAVAQLLQSCQEQGERYFEHESKSRSQSDDSRQYCDTNIWQSPHVAFFHVEPQRADTGDTPKKPVSFSEMIEMMMASVKTAMPHSHIVMLTDRTTKAPDMVDKIVRTDSDCSELMLARIGMQREYLEQSPDDCPIVFADTDLLFNGDLTGVFSGLCRASAHVGLTRRFDSAEMPYNGGVIFVRNHPLVRDFWSSLRERAARLPSEYRKWNCDQVALGSMVDRRQHVLGSDAAAVGCAVKGLGILQLPCEIYNYSPNTLEQITEKRRILHFKGNRKSLMMEAYRRLHSPMRAKA